MPNEDQMYELICKDRFDKIDESLEKLNEKLSGNPGLVSRLAIVEEQTKANTSRWKRVFGAIIALASAVIGKFLYGFWK